MLAYADSNSTVFKSPTQTAADGTTVWARGFYGQRFANDNGLSLRNVTNFDGATLGVDTPVSPDLRIGGYAGGGAFNNSTSIQSSSAKSDLGFGGLYGRYSLNAAFVDLALMGGEGRIRSSRAVFNNLAVNGVEFANASYNVAFVSPEAAAGYRVKLDDNWTLTPSAHLRYLATRFGSYAETGSAANLNVASRTAQSLEERGELKLSRVFSGSGYGDLAVSLAGGVLGQQRVGNSAINTVLLGQALSFATPSKAATTGAYAETHMQLGLTKNVAVFLGGDHTRMSDRSSTTTVNGGMKVAF